MIDIPVKNIKLDRLQELEKSIGLLTDMGTTKSIAKEPHLTRVLNEDGSTNEEMCAKVLRIMELNSELERLINEVMGA